MSNNTYLALTIGPIYRTLTEAKRTRAVWAASYFLSWFIRRILEEAVTKKMNIFLPYHEEICKGKHGSGLYADRLYFIQDEKTTETALREIIESVKQEVEAKSGGAIRKSFLDDYLNLHLLSITPTEEERKSSFDLAIINQRLDNKELHKNYNFDFEKNDLQEYFANKTKSIENFLAADAFGESDNERKFRSISEISTTTFSRLAAFKNEYIGALRQGFKPKDNEDTDLINLLIKKSLDIKPHHKYYAVIYADGDNIGQLLKEINKKNLDIKAFSKTLFDFGIKAENAIADYGGNGIYLGGEDILTFAPIACVKADKPSERQNIFQLITKLDEIFSETVLKYAKDNQLPKPSMSYGIIMSYYKHPLKEAMAEAHHQLDGKAKKALCKNAIAIRFQKHSGQYMECVIEKSKTCSLSAIYDIVNEYCKTEIDKDNKELQAKLDKRGEILSSIIQRFRDDAFTHLYIEATKLGHLDSFFDNFFNEDIHKENDKAKFLKAVKSFSEKIINDYPKEEDCKSILYMVLRYIHFINSSRE